MDFEKREELAFQRRLELTNLLKIFYNFLYFLGICPFRFVLKGDVESGCRLFHKKVWRPQQFLCAFLHILSIFLLVSQIRETLTVPINQFPHLKNPSLYFDLVRECCSFSFKVVTLKRLWCNSNEYRSILNVILKEKDLPAKNQWTDTAAFASCLYGFCTFKVFSCLVTGYNFVIPVSSWSPSWWCRRLVEQSRFVFCFGPLSPPQIAPELAHISIWDCALAGLMLISQFTRRVLGEFCDLFITAHVLTVWTTASCYADGVEKLDRQEMEDELTDGNKIEDIDPLALGAMRRTPETKINRKHESSWNKLYRGFQAIQNLTEAVNKAIGVQVTWYLAEGLMYYSTHLNVLFITKDMFRRCYNLCFFVVSFFLLYMSADICSQMNSVKSWLVKRNHIKSVPKEEAYVVLLEVTTNEIGIQGNDTYTITFALAGGYLSLIVTFFIICVQESDITLMGTVHH